MVTDKKQTDLTEELKKIQRRLSDLERYGSTSGSSISPAVTIGLIIPFAGGTVPTGWLECDGSAVSRTTYADLFSAIGTTYGSGDGSTTFNLPNLKGRVPVGYDASQTEFNTIGKTGGEKTHTLSVNEMPSHTHTQNRHRHWISSADRDDGNLTGTGGNGQNYGLFSDAGSYQNYDLGRSTGRYDQWTTATNQNTGGGQAHNNLQPYNTFKYIIAYSANGALGNFNTGNTWSPAITPTGSVDGSNKLFTVNGGYVAGSLMVYKNGVAMRGDGDNYTETDPSAGTFTFTTAPASGDTIWVHKQIAGGAGDADTVDGYHASSLSKNWSYGVDPLIHLRQSVNQTCPNATTTMIEWTLQKTVRGFTHSTSSNPTRIYVPSDGLYWFGGILRIQGVDSSPEEKSIDIWKNGSVLYKIGSSDGGGTASFHVPFKTFIELQAGDYVEIGFFQNSGGNLNTYAGDTHWRCNITGYKVR